MANVETISNYRPRRRRAGKLSPFLEEIRSEIRDAVDYFEMDVAPEISRGLEYFHGATGLTDSDGRSKAVSTQVRDAIRNTKPSIMRTLCSSRTLVQYKPGSANPAVTAALEQQSAYVHQQFWQNGGYWLLMELVDESLKCRMCPVKTYWEPNTAPTFARLTMLTEAELDALEQQPDVRLLDVVENDNSPIGGIAVFDVEIEKLHLNGKTYSRAVPVNEFFISRGASNTADARVHGHQRSVTVAEAIEMGLDYKNWWDLDDFPAHGQSEVTSKRGKADHSARIAEEQERGDVLSHKFILTEAYINIDLNDADSNQVYCIYFGGSDYRYMAHYRETESPFDLAIPDPIAFTAYGQSLPDLMCDQQDVMTSLLRGAIDNVHAANRPRLAADPRTVNFDDLLHHEIDYPIRMKAGGQVQVIAIPSTLQGTLPLLQWLETDSQQKVGITRAASGLDPDAMQSTDKDAVKNTIMLGQGQVELMVRNIVETAIIPIFRKQLRLSIQHLDRYQVIRLRGEFVEVDQLLFDPNLYAEPVVGLGTKPDEQKVMGLNFTLEKQLFILERLGMGNPFVNSSHIYNTLEDMTQLFGLYDVNRYWNHVTPETEQAYKKQKQQEAAQQPQPMDPGQALIQTEKIKAGVRKFEIVSSERKTLIDNEFKALEANAKDDLERDRMAQERSLAAAKLFGETKTRVDENQIKREQAATRDPAVSSKGGSSENTAKVVTQKVPQPVKAPGASSEAVPELDVEALTPSTQSASPEQSGGL